MIAVARAALPAQAGPPAVEQVDQAVAAPTGESVQTWQLMQDAQAGDTAAFGELYRRYEGVVFRFVYSRVGHRQLAEDLTSEAFLRAFKRIETFTWQGRDVGAWFATIARNLVFDHFKSGRFRNESLTADPFNADCADTTPEGSPEATLVEHLGNVELLRVVQQLNPEQQECIRLRFLVGLNVAETAAAMGKQEGAIKALQYRAVRSLARLLPDSIREARR